MLNRWGVAGLLLVLAAGTAAAQTSRYTGQGSATAPAVVPGAPFSADLITSYDRAADNGGHIRRETQGKIFRDGQGRTRTETEVLAPPPSTEKWRRITINDPVRQQVIYLNPNTRTATIYHFGEGMGPTATVPTPSGDLGSQQTSKTEKKSVVTANKGSSIHFGGPVAPAPPVATGAVNGRTTIRPAGTVSTSSHMALVHTTPTDTRIEPLGAKQIAGVTANGTRTTRTVSGGDKPIVIVSETWFSPELNTNVLTSTDDGEAGHSVMKLVNITLAEPDAQLFQIPPGYTVKENVPSARH